MTRDEKQFRLRRRGEFAQMLRDDARFAIIAAPLLIFCLLAGLSAWAWMENLGSYWRRSFEYAFIAAPLDIQFVAFWVAVVLISMHLFRNSNRSTVEGRKPFVMTLWWGLTLQGVAFFLLILSILGKAFVAPHSAQAEVFIPKWLEDEVLWTFPLGAAAVCFLWSTMPGMLLGAPAAFAIPGKELTLPLFWLSIFSFFTPTTWLAGACMPMHRQLVWLWKPRRLPRIPPEGGYRPPRGQHAMPAVEESSENQSEKWNGITTRTMLLPAGRRGVTLIELLIQVAIMAILSATIVNVAGALHRQVRRQEQVRDAVLAAQSQIALLRAQPEKVVAGEKPFDAQIAARFPGAARGVCRVSAESAALWRVEVEVPADFEYTSQATTLATLIAKSEAAR